MASTHAPAGFLGQSPSHASLDSNSSSPRPIIKTPRNHIPAMSNDTPSTTPQIPRSTDDNCDGRKEDMTSTKTISTTARMAGQTVAPFLQKHIPEVFGPGGVQQRAASHPQKDPSTKYCYRHRPDSKCRRTADEPSMENLQRELDTLPASDQQAISTVWSLYSAAPAKMRTLMLQGILTQCCFPQLSYLSNAVRDLIRIDFISALPTEIAYKILCYLDTTSLCKAAQVSQRWRALADDDVVWHRMCEQHIDRKCTKCGWGLPLLERKRLRDWKRQRQLRATGRGLNEWSPEPTPPPDRETALILGATNGTKRHAGSLSPEITKRQCTSSQLAQAPPPENNDPTSPTAFNNHPTSLASSRPKFRPWKDVYKARFKVGTNWKYGRCTSTKVFRGHTNGVMCLQFSEEFSILATGSYDSTIKIWDLESGECLRTLKGHGSGVRCLQFDECKLVSGSLDRTMKVWNWRTGECVATYSAHSDGVIGLSFDGNILASGSIDSVVKIWNFEDKTTFCLQGHSDWVNCVRVDAASRTVVSASDDCSVRLWDLDDRSCVRVLEGHVGQVQQVVLMPSDYEPELDSAGPADDAGARSPLLPIPHVNGANGATARDHGNAHAHAAAPNSGATPKSMTDTELRASYGRGFITSPSRPLPPRYILTAALDSTVRLWDTSTGTCLRAFFGHVEGIWALAADTLRCVSGAEDRMVKVWDARTGRCERTFTGHAGPVTCVGLSDSRMCTGSEDCEVRMYCFFE
jgi:F-box/WD-40 domain protein MET30